MSQCAFADKKFRGYPQLLFGTYCIMRIVTFMRYCPKQKVEPSNCGCGQRHRCPAYSSAGHSRFSGTNHRCTPAGSNVRRYDEFPDRSMQGKTFAEDGTEKGLNRAEIWNGSMNVIFVDITKIVGRCNYSSSASNLPTLWREAYVFCWGT